MNWRKKKSFASRTRKYTSYVFSPCIKKIKIKKNVQLIYYIQVSNLRILRLLRNLRWLSLQPPGKKK